MNVECELLTLTTEDSDELLAFLHADDCSVLEDDLDGLVGECCEIGQSVNRHLFNDHIASAHVLNVEPCLLQLLLDCALLISEGDAIDKCRRVEDVVLHHCESVQQDHLEVDELGLFLLVSNLLERNRLVRK